MVDMFFNHIYLIQKEIHVHVPLHRIGRMREKDGGAELDQLTWCKRHLVEQGEERKAILECECLCVSEWCSPTVYMQTSALQLGTSLLAFHS